MSFLFSSVATSEREGEMEREICLLSCKCCLSVVRRDVECFKCFIYENEELISPPCVTNIAFRVLLQCFLFGMYLRFFFIITVIFYYIINKLIILVSDPY
jgi:hypothetical protein